MIAHKLVKNNYCKQQPSACMVIFGLFGRETSSSKFNFLMGLLAAVSHEVSSINSCLILLHIFLLLFIESVTYPWATLEDSYPPSYWSIMLVPPALASIVAEVTLKLCPVYLSMSGKLRNFATCFGISPKSKLYNVLYNENSIFV